MLRTTRPVPWFEIAVLNSNGSNDCEYLLTSLLSVSHRWFKHECDGPTEITRLSTERFA